MKRKEYTELKGKTIKELVKIASTKKAEAIKKKMQVLGGKEKNLKVYRNSRLEIAKILTLIREKEILDKVEPEVKKEK
jgi:ribosomal protein L29